VNSSIRKQVLTTYSTLRESTPLFKIIFNGCYSAIYRCARASIYGLTSEATSCPSYGTIYRCTRASIYSLTSAATSCPRCSASTLSPSSSSPSITASSLTNKTQSKEQNRNQNQNQSYFRVDVETSKRLLANQVKSSQVKKLPPRLPHPRGKTSQITTQVKSTPNSKLQIPNRKPFTNPV
jgi:hypothetical protein